jgi:hypothetical protein
MEASPETEPSKPSKMNSEVFEGSVSSENQIIQPTDRPEPPIPIIGKSPYTEPSKPSKVPQPPGPVSGMEQAIPAGLPPLAGRMNSRGQMVLTMEDIPELEERLRWQGWKVKRQGFELVCTSPGGLKIQ